LSPPASHPLPTSPLQGPIGIKHDGYRLIVRRDGKAVRLFTRRGYDWTDRYPAIAAVAAKLRARSFTLRSPAPMASPCSKHVANPLERCPHATFGMLVAPLSTMLP
jgi:hypothetical protein